MTFDSIEDASRAELGRILRFLSGYREGARPPVLVGGWPVYFLAGPNYLKSQDMDLVLNAKHRHRLLYHLTSEEGYSKATIHADGWRGAEKRVPELDQAIVVDIATYAEQYPFYGRTERLDFSLVEGHAQEIEVDGIPVRVPDRSLLVLFKSKAAYDRAARLAAHDDPRPDWTRAKLAKDRADIIALVTTGTDWDLAFLHKQLARLPFLIDVWRLAYQDEEALARGGHDAKSAREAIEELLAAVGIAAPSR